MNKTLVAAAAAASLIGGVAGVAALTGRLVTERLTQRTAQLSKLFPAFKVVDEHVERGLFSSTRTVTVQLGCLPDAAGRAGVAAQPLQLRWRDRVQHGPFPGGRRLAFARVETELLPEAWQAKLNEQLAGKPLLQVDTQIDFGGALAGEARLARVTWSDPTQGSVVLSPVVAQFSATTGTGGASVYTLEVPAVSLRTSARGETLQLELRQLRSAGELRLDAGPSPWLSPGKLSGGLASLELTGSGPGLSGAPGKPLHASFEAVQFSAESKLERGLWSGVNRASLRGKIDEFPIDKLTLQASIKRMHAAAYHKLLERLLESALSCDPATREAGLTALPSDLRKDLFELLAHDPEYALDSLAIELAGKRAELSYAAGTRGISTRDFDADISELLVRKGVLRASAKIQIALLIEIAAKLGESLPAGAGAVGLRPQDPAQGAALVNGMIDQFVGSGYLERDGEFIKASCAVEGGQLTVNGKPMGLPDVPKLAP